MPPQVFHAASPNAISAAEEERRRRQQARDAALAGVEKRTRAAYAPSADQIVAEDLERASMARALAERGAYQNRYRAPGPLGGVTSWIANKITGNKRREEYEKFYTRQLGLRSAVARAKDEGVVNRAVLANRRASDEFLSSQRGLEDRQKLGIDANVDLQARRFSAEKRAASQSQNWLREKLTGRDVYNPDGSGSIMHVFENSQGITYVNTGEGLVVFDGDASKLIDYDPGARGSQLPTQQWKSDIIDEHINEKMTGNLFVKLLTNPLLDAATGWFNFEAQMSDITAWTPRMREIQSIRVSMNNLKVHIIAPALELVGPKPTDTDLKIILAGAPGPNKSPQVWFDWFNDRYIPLARLHAEKYIELGENKYTIEEVDKRLTIMQQAVRKAEAEYKISKRSTGEEKIKAFEIERQNLIDQYPNLGSQP